MIRNIIKLNYELFNSKNFKQNRNKYKIPLLSFINKYSTIPNLTKEDINDEEKTENNKNIDREKMLKILHLEVDVARQEGRRVPDPTLLKEDHWNNLLSLKSRSARTKYYLYLWQLEKKRENESKKKLLKSQEILERKQALKEENEKNNHIIYGINHTTFLLRIYDSTINFWQNNKLISAMQFNPKLVLDCGYDEHMNKREATNTAKQLMLLFAENRFHNEPFDLHFCNANLNEIVMKTLHRHIPTMMETSFPLNIHEKCFTEVFPKEKLVYLTPHCKNDLNTYNSDDIYIIGAIVDKTNSEPLSLAKAKKLGIRMARLPLDQYLAWGAGSGKSLTLDQMINIMLDIKTTGNWNTALRFVPRRKLSNEWEPKKRDKLNIRAKKFEFDISTWGNPKPLKRNPFK